MNIKAKEELLMRAVTINWLKLASQLPGKSLHVALAICQLCNINEAKKFILPGKFLRTWGIQRTSAYRGLKQLEDSGLILVERHLGKNPRVTIIDVSENTRSELSSSGADKRQDQKAEDALLVPYKSASEVNPYASTEKVVQEQDIFNAEREKECG